MEIKALGTRKDLSSNEYRGGVSFFPFYTSFTEKEFEVI